MDQWHYGLIEAVLESGAEWIGFVAPMYEVGPSTQDVQITMQRVRAPEQYSQEILYGLPWNTCLILPLFQARALRGETH